MIQFRKSGERGRIQTDWLNSHHSFSFGSYYDPRFMGFRSLRVINEDTIAPKGGFPTHSHQDMEIITYMISGALEHRDSMGNLEIIHPGELQRMSAGTGIQHSEFNASGSEPAHLLQIWIEPKEHGITPGYEQRFVRDVVQPGNLGLVVAPEGKGGALTIHSDARLYAGILEKNQKLTYILPPKHHAWIQMIRGKLSLNRTSLQAGDGAAISEEDQLQLLASKSSEFLLFELY
ncbi:MAG TPA: pirin family protein [Deltaproteobacteria bacterium]|jgi:redox-sensitive bicupin YhaK (pirin superfamily)|nr:pirin family protein [Candidatus Lambdaproteobacteria bacterium]HIL16516.1 pirin family protein [Deltaproteobacteria bacterium]